MAARFLAQNFHAGGEGGGASLFVTAATTEDRPGGSRRWIAETAAGDVASQPEIDAARVFQSDRDMIWTSASRGSLLVLDQFSVYGSRGRRGLTLSWS